MTNYKITDINTALNQVKQREKEELSRKIKVGIALSQKRKDASTSESSRKSKSKAHSIRRRKIEFYNKLKELLDVYVGSIMSEDVFESFVKQVVEKVMDDLENDK